MPDNLSKHLLKIKKADFIQNLILFFAILFAFHFIYLWWSNNEFKPFKAEVNNLFNYTGRALFTQSDAIIHYLHIKHYQKGNTIFFPKRHTRFQSIHKSNALCYLEISPNCTSFKQWLLWIFLMMVIPGPLKHKIWYVPTGVVILHLLNVIRIVGLAIVLANIPHQFNFYHDYFFKILFYSGIFLLWIGWMEGIMAKKSLIFTNVQWFKALAK